MPKTLDLSFVSNYENEDTNFENYLRPNNDDQGIQFGAEVGLHFKCSFCSEAFASQKFRDHHEKSCGNQANKFGDFNIQKSRQKMQPKMPK